MVFARFGFVKYYSFPDAENCIRGFTFCGYETSFARESFYAQLKKLSEPHNTNLYVRNRSLQCQVDKLMCSSRSPTCQKT